MHTEILLLRAGSIERHENNHNEKKIARIVVVRPEHILFGWLIGKAIKSCHRAYSARIAQMSAAWPNLSAQIRQMNLIISILSAQTQRT